MYKRFFTTQRKFDNKVIRQLGIQKPSLTQKATALLTEIGEFSNEEGSVKYWKKRKKQNLQAALAMLRFPYCVIYPSQVNYSIRGQTYVFSGVIRGVQAIVEGNEVRGRNKRQYVPGSETGN